MVRRLSACSKSLAAFAACGRQNIASLLFSKVQHFDQQQPGQTVNVASVSASSGLSVTAPQ